MTKIIFLDIDGTLLSFRTHRVPASTIEAVRRARQQGVKVWIATGRPLPFVSNLEGLEYDGIMCVNGAQCQIQSPQQTTQDVAVIHSQPIPRADVERMIAEQRRTGLPVVYAGNERAILTAPDGIPSAVDEIFTYLDIKCPPLFEPEEALSFTVMQIIGFYEETDQKHIIGDILKGCSDTRWHPVFADCIAKGTSKATGIDHVIRHYGIDLSETMAFGDGGNDIEMLRHAGIGVAMGNASDDVKAAADIVTTSVDEDGVANIINKLVLPQ
ncbi:MAG: Cof-type HAD-IIB family hydrolase [Bacteroidaceae bacterium]|nr:Cof-type HAD-IIB family hydrolase [Bacteroidaceae bacterium]